MLNRIKPRLTYANVVSSIALFAVLGGGAYAGIDRKRFRRGTSRSRRSAPASSKPKAVGTGKLKRRAVGTGKLKDGAVANPKIIDGAVTAAKLGTGQVTTSKIATGAVTEGTLAAGLQARIAELETEVAELQALLAGVSRETADGNDTLRFSEMNVQVVNGTGTTSGTPNGLGNLIVGYSAQPRSQADRTGSHYLVVGDRHEWTAFGGILAGLSNTASDAWAAVSGGQSNTASGIRASVSGGLGNTASGFRSSILGGDSNTVSDANACHPNC